MRGQGESGADHGGLNKNAKRGEKHQLEMKEKMHLGIHLDLGERRGSPDYSRIVLQLTCKIYWEML
jgi:hypothetical protein